MKKYILNRLRISVITVFVILLILFTMLEFMPGSPFNDEKLTASQLEALEKACHQLDVSRPMVLARHERDWEQFSQARFLKEHFVEDVPFDRMEVEFIDPDKKRKKQNPYASFL